MTIEELQSQLKQAESSKKMGNHEEARLLALSILDEIASSSESSTNVQELTFCQAGATRLLGSIASLRGEYDASMQFFNRAVQLSQDCGDSQGEASCYCEIGTLYRYLSDYAKAEEYNLKALGLQELHGGKSIMAAAYGNLGSIMLSISDYAAAHEYHMKALEIFHELGSKNEIATVLRNIGITYRYQSDFAKALEYYSQAMSIYEEQVDRHGIASLLMSIGNIHLSLSDYPSALNYYNRSMQLQEELGAKANIGQLHSNMARVYVSLSDYPRALEYFEKSMRLGEELGNRAEAATDLGSIGIVYKMLGDFSRAQELIEQAVRVLSELGRKIEVAQFRVELAELYASPDNPERDEQKAETLLLGVLEVDKEIGTREYNVYKTLADLYERQQRLSESIEMLKKYYALRDEVQSEEAKKTAVRFEQQRIVAEREKEIAVAQATAEAKISATTSLLHKVLPESVATRMINGDNEIADYYTSVSILFADIAGFTPLSADMPAIIVVRFLNFVFAEFDRIIKKHGCEKIKTIGDGYMAVCGAPIECPDHAERLAAAAVEMQQTIVLPESIREHLPDDTKLGVRIGLHTGSVVAGVIGEERFVYDIYSDAVNIAARMESHGEENKIHCSNDFYRHMQNRFAMTKNTTHGLVFNKRGEMEIKGKGMMRTYFMERV